MLKFVFSIESVLIPIIICIGLIGNTISAIVFFQPNLRKTSCSLYLGARAISDNGFLVSLFVIWIHNMRVDVFRAPGMCQGEVFFSYLCAFLSVWYVVWVTVENFYRICRPFKVATFCTVRKAKIVICVTLIIGCCFYFVSLITTTTSVYRGIRDCVGHRDYMLINTILSYGDTLVTLVIPSVVIILTTGRIVYGLVLSLKKQQAPTKKGSGAMQTKVTRLLFFVSLIFLVLNLPSHTFRLKMTVESWISDSLAQNMTPTNYLLQHLFQQVYYLSFSVNFFLYVTLGESFRQTCLQIFCRGLHGRLQRQRSGCSSDDKQSETSARLLTTNATPNSG